jgi:hypothetical protein
MRKLIESFFEKAPEECGAIYNERSLQLELAYSFRHMGAHVEFERHFQISPFGDSTCPPKSNLDLLVRNGGLTAAIELKVPFNGQHPETLYSFCNDIAFVEGIVRSKFADEGYCLLVTNDPVFWADSGRGSAIHNLFRCRGSKLTGVIGRPTGKKDTTVALSGCYAPADSWRAVRDQRIIPRAQYLLLAIGSEPLGTEAGLKNAQATRG